MVAVAEICRNGIHSGNGDGGERMTEEKDWAPQPLEIHKVPKLNPPDIATVSEFSG